jgi:hypothetical protein
MAIMQRDIRLDACRGLLLVVITADHLLGELYKLLWECLGFFSAAEGFFFISGLVSGLTLDRLREREGGAATMRRGLRRAGRIYVFYVGTLALVLLGGVWGGPLAELILHRIPVAEGDLLGGFIAGALLYFQPPFFAVLHLYVLLMLLSPLPVLYGRGSAVHAWLAGSVLVWLLAQGPLRGEVLQAAFGWPHPASGYLFNPFGWQIVFLLGVALALLSRRGVRVVPGGRLATVCAVIFLALLAARYGLIDVSRWAALEGGDLRNWTGRPLNLNPVRLLDFLAFAGIVAWSAARFPGVFRVPPLALLGRHSLEVFCFQLLLVYSIGATLWKLRTFGPLPPRLTSLLIEAAAIASLFPFAWAVEVWKARGGPRGAVSQGRRPA